MVEFAVARNLKIVLTLSLLERGETEEMGKRILSLWCGLLVILLCVGVVGCASNDAASTAPTDTENKLKVVATTSLITDIVQNIGQAQVEVACIIPPASCPGHFDVKPSDLKVLSDARLFFLHNWQGEKFSDDLIKTAGNDKLQKVVLAVEGNWMVPTVQTAAIDQITAVLAEADPDHSAQYQAAAAEYKQQVAQTGKEQKARLTAANVGAVKVLANEQQAGFLKWAGFNVVGTFGRAEDITPQQMAALIELGRTEGVSLVVDNLQSGGAAGPGIAAEIGAKQVTISNFPGGLPNTEHWVDTIINNVDLLLGSLAK